MEDWAEIQTTEAEPLINSTMALLRLRNMDSREGTDDLGEMRCELTRLAERLSDLAVEHSNTWRRRDQVVVDLYRAGVDPEEIACLAHLMAVDARRLAQEQANRPPGRSTGTSPAPRQDPSHP